MTKSLLLFLVLTLLGVNTHAQSCHPKSAANLQEPIGLFTTEIEGFEFFAKGRLSTLRLGLSSRADVVSLLGEPHSIYGDSELYELDEEWSLQIDYFSQRSALSGSFAGGKVTYWKALPGYYGKVGSVVLRAKKSLAIAEKIKTEQFSKQDYNRVFKATRFSDDYGIAYVVFEGFLREKDQTRYPYKKGDILEIEYNIECLVQRKIFQEDVRNPAG